MKTATITAPKGMIINEKAFNEGKIEFIPENEILSDKWKLDKNNLYLYITSASSIRELASSLHTLPEHKNSLSSLQLAEAMLALCQLLVMRDKYNGDWKPDYTDTTKKYTISFQKNYISLDVVWEFHRILAFKTQELACLFLKNFKDLIEIAKPLL
jgi:hypothetical protein